MVKKKVRSIGRERETVDGREQNRREISRVRVKDVKVPISSSAEADEYRRWKNNLLWWSACTQITLEMQAPHVIMNGITTAELNEVDIRMDRDEAHTESGITSISDVLDEYLTPNRFLELAQIYRQCKKCEKGPMISSNEYMKRMKRYRMEMNEAETTIKYRVFSIALLEKSNLDEATKIFIGNKAQNKGHGGTEVEAIEKLKVT